MTARDVRLLIRTPEEETIERLANEIKPIIQRMLMIERTTDQIKVDNQLKAKAGSLISMLTGHGFDVRGIDFTPPWRRSLALVNELAETDSSTASNALKLIKACALLSDRKCVVQFESKKTMHGNETEIVLEFAISLDGCELIAEVSMLAPFEKRVKPRIESLILNAKKIKEMKLEVTEHYRPIISRMNVGNEVIENRSGAFFRLVGTTKVESISREFIDSLVESLKSLIDEEMMEPDDLVEIDEYDMTPDGNFGIAEKKEMRWEDYLNYLASKDIN